MENDKEKLREKVEIILNSDYLTVPTRRVLKERQNKRGEPQFFDADVFHLLSVVCNLLLDQDPDEEMVNIALAIDERLFENGSNGWRYDEQPPDPMAYQLGLKALNAEAESAFGNSFTMLSKEQQVLILANVQKGETKSTGWEKVNPKLFFEDLLTESAEIFFSHPTVQAQIGYVGMADARGWTKIKLNQSENIEKL